jgi:hypothetical protein
MTSEPNLQEMRHCVSVNDTDKRVSLCKECSRAETRENYHHYGEEIENKNHPIWNEIKNTIREFRPDIFGITSITAKIESADIVAGIAKELFGDNLNFIVDDNTRKQNTFSPKLSHSSVVFPRDIQAKA